MGLPENWIGERPESAAGHLVAVLFAAFSVLALREQITVHVGK
jgi:hypothetical protein